MGERTLVVDHLKFSYNGLFNLPELYNLIGSWFFEKGYDWHEKVNQEQITPEGKHIRIVLTPWKNVTDYYKLIFHLKFHCTDIKDVEVEHESKALKLNQGQVRIIFDGYVYSDRHDKWEKKPLHWFINLIAQKYFFKNHFEKAEDWIKSDIDDLHHKIKSYLNVFKYNYQT